MVKKEWELEEEEEEGSEEASKKGNKSRLAIALLASLIIGWLSWYIVGLWGAILVSLVMLGFLASALTGGGGEKALPVIALVLGGIFGWWLAGIAGLTLLIPILVWFGLSHSLKDEEGKVGAEDQFLRIMGVILSFIPFIILYVWPIIGGFFGSQVSMVQSGLGDFMGLISRQKDLLNNADYRNYMGMKDSVYDTSSQEAETFSNPTSAFEISSFTITPDSGCFGRATFSLFGVIKNTGDSVLNNVYVGFKLDPEQIDTDCGTAMGDLGYRNVCEDEDGIDGTCVFNTWCVTGDSRENLRYVDIECDPGEENWGCYCVSVRKINTLHPDEVSQFVEILNDTHEVEVESLSCRLFAFARANYHVKSRLEVTAMDSNYSLLKGSSSFSAPAVQSIGPVKLKMDIGNQPVLDIENQRVLQIALANEGRGELISLWKVVLFLPTEFSEKCEGGQFIDTYCSKLVDEGYVIDGCESMQENGYRLYEVDPSILGEYTSYACIMEIEQKDERVDLGGENRKSFIFRADAFYDYRVSSSAIIGGGSC